MAKHPNTKVYERSIPGSLDHIEFEAPEFNLGSWSPQPAGTPNPKCTQVHLFIHSKAGKVLIRFKSAEVMDDLLSALMEHREKVFGPVS